MMQKRKNLKEKPKVFTITRKGKENKQGKVDKTRLEEKIQVIYEIKK